MHITWKHIYIHTHGMLRYIDLHIHNILTCIHTGDVEAGSLLTVEIFDQLKSELLAAGVSQTHIEQVNMIMCMRVRVRVRM